MSFLLLNTQWVCLPFFRVLDVRKFCGCVTSRVQLRPPLSRGNTSLGSRSNLRAHWHAWKPQPIYRMFHSMQTASFLGDLSISLRPSRFIYKAWVRAVDKLQTCPWRPWTAINLCMKLARFLRSWGTFNNYKMSESELYRNIDMDCRINNPV